MQAFLNLMWREFHELKWTVAAALAIVTAAPLLCSLQVEELAWHWVRFCLVIYPFAAGILFGMYLAAGERGQKTAALLAATPVSPRRLGLSKLLCTAAAALLPIGQLGLLGNLVHGWAEPAAAGQSIWTYCGTSALCTLNILLVVGVFGLGQRTELLAAGRGLVVLAAWTVIVLGVSRYPDWQLLQLVRFVGPPLEWFEARELANIKEAWLQVAGVILVEAMLVVLATLFVIRYQWALLPLAESPRLDWPLPVWRPRLSSPLSALWWKQLRETVPFGLLLLAVSALLSIAWSFLPDAASADLLQRGRALDAIYIFAVATAVGGFALALLIGVGTFAADLEPRVYAFWRSRPISVHQWFWSKFAIGFAAVVLTVGVPGLAATAVLSRFDDQLRLTEAPLYILFYWFCMYAAAVLATCVVRHILYAAMLAIGLLVLMFWLPFLPRVLSLYAEHPTTTAQAAVCLTAACVCVVLAWQSAARNFAWRTS